METVSIFKHELLQQTLEKHYKAELPPMGNYDQGSHTWLCKEACERPKEIHCHATVIKTHTDYCDTASFPKSLLKRAACNNSDIIVEDLMEKNVTSDFY